MANPSTLSPDIDKSGSRIRAMFGEISPRYDFLNHLLSLQVDRYWRWRTTRRVPPSLGQPLLDLCTGTADLALAYDRRAKGRCPIVGADFCHPMLVLGREKIARAGATSRIRLIEADAQRLPFPNDHFAVLSVAFGLRNLNDPDRGLAEMVRVLRPGGQIAVLEFSTPRLPLLRQAYLFYFRRILPRIGRFFERGQHDAYHYLPSSVLGFPESEALAGKLTEHGLEAVAWYPLTLGVVTLYVGRKPGQHRGPDER